MPSDQRLKHDGHTRVIFAGGFAGSWRPSHRTTRKLFVGHCAFATVILILPGRVRLRPTRTGKLNHTQLSDVPMPQLIQHPSLPGPRQAGGINRQRNCRTTMNKQRWPRSSNALCTRCPGVRRRNRNLAPATGRSRRRPGVPAARRRLRRNFADFHDRAITDTFRYCCKWRWS